MKFTIGDSVKVKRGIQCPDDKSVDVSGWQGRIFDIEDDLIGIRWDSITLKHVPEKYIKNSEEDGFDWTELYLSADEVEPALPRDLEGDAESFAEKIAGKALCFGTGKEGERILKVIDGAEDEVEAWNSHLNTVLTFPFEAEISEPQDRGSLKYGDSVTVLGISGTDDLYGILVDITYGRKRYVFPLCDLNALDKNSKNYTPVKDYCVWFANR
jgi:hypothetical protein